MCPTPPNPVQRSPRYRPEGKWVQPANQPPTTSRDAACRVLLAHCERFPDIDHIEPDTSKLAARDARLTHTIVDAAVRQWRALEAILATRLGKPFESLQPEVRAALLAGAAQLLLLDRIPVHAAIDESVEWVKRRIGRGPGGFVNAVLRRIADGVESVSEPNTLTPETFAQAIGDPSLLLRTDGSAVRLKTPIFPAQPAAWLAYQTSVSAKVIHAWASRYRVISAHRLALQTLTNPPAVVNVGSPRATLPEALTRHEQPNFAAYVGRPGHLPDVLRHLDRWAQDSAAGAVIDLISDLNPIRILDLCAGRGTKTRQLAERFPHADIVATDTDGERLNTLRDVVEPLGVRVEPYETITPDLGGFDLILLDVPCSNSGVLSRRIEARHRLSPKQTERLVGIQREILTHARTLLSTTGKILYATCSIDPAENDEQPRWAAKTLGMRIEREHLRLPAGAPGSPPTAHSDGSYAALLTQAHST